MHSPVWLQACEWVLRTCCTSVRVHASKCMHSVHCTDIVCCIRVRTHASECVHEGIAREEPAAMSSWGETSPAVTTMTD